MSFNHLVESILESITNNTLGPFVVLKVDSNSILVNRPYDTPLKLQLSQSIDSTKIETGKQPYYFQILNGKVVSMEEA